MDLFDYAHKHWKEIVWMSQNTNQHFITDEIEEAIIQGVKERKFNLYPRAKGLFELPEAILEDLGVPGDYQVLLTNGGIEALYIATRALLKEGDEVICTDPSFMPIHQEIKLSKAIPVELPIYQPPWKLTPEQILENITSRTKAILLIDPINPLGTAYSRDEVKAICEIAEENDLLVIDDITYRDFSADHTGTYEFIPDRTIVAISFSKSCGLAGMRIGALVAPRELMDIMRPYNTNVLSVNILAQHAALAALRVKQEWLPRVSAEMLENQEIIKSTVEKVDGAFLPIFPSHTNMFVIDISQTGINPDDVQEKLLLEHKVFIRSGSYVSPRFGKKFIRVSFSVPKEGAMRFAEAFPIVMEQLRE